MHSQQHTSSRTIKIYRKQLTITLNRLNREVLASRAWIKLAGNLDTQLWSTNNF